MEPTRWRDKLVKWLRSTTASWEEIAMFLQLHLSSMFKGLTEKFRFLDHRSTLNFYIRTKFACRSLMSDGELCAHLNRRAPIDGELCAHLSRRAPTDGELCAHLNRRAPTDEELCTHIIRCAPTDGERCAHLNRRSGVKIGIKFIYN